MCFGKLHFTTISRENATDLKLSTRAFALPCAHIPFIQLEEQRNALNVSTPSKKVSLTPEVKISLRARFCLPSIKWLNDKISEPCYTLAVTIVNDDLIGNRFVSIFLLG